MTAHTLSEALAAQVAAGPDRIAVTAPDGTLTYQQLADRSDALAERLRRAGVAAGDLVGLSTGRNLAMIVGMLAIVRAGAAYLPIDPAVPAARLRRLIEQSGAVLTVTDGSTAAGAGDGVLLLDGNDAAPSANRTGHGPAVDASDPLAYVIYTSGSTGEPKGVAVSHRNVLALLAQTEELFHFTAEDVWTMFHSVAFDFSVWEIWGSLLHGGRLVVVDEQVARSPVAFRRLLVEQGVTVLNQTPSAFLPLIGADRAAPDRLSRLRLVILGGERVSMSAMRPWLDRYGDESPRLVNMYGVTECTVFSSYRPISRTDLDRSEFSPIGGPLPGNRFLVLGPDGRPVPAGEPGELFVLGETVSAGYLGRPEVTGERFAACPAAGGERAYRTGDLVVRQPDGDHCFLGRNDRQLKVRGYRVDPLEVERQLLSLDEVGAAAVVARDFGDGDVRLVGHLVPPPGLPAEQDWAERVVEQARKSLAEVLPANLCPSMYQTHDVLPRTANGKVDLAALAAALLYASSDQTTDRAALGADQSSAVPVRITRIWQSVLDVDDLDAEDDFFDLGGTSLSLIRMFEQVNSTFGLRMDVQVLLDGATVTALSAAVMAARPELSNPSPMSEMAVDS
jgi:amino acid adenylation domain-containing protein